MNLKYYLRGLGIGITVTSVILSIAMGNGRESLTNEEIKERAKALGMVEGSMTVAEAAAQNEAGEPDAQIAPAKLQEKETGVPAQTKSPDMSLEQETEQEEVPTAETATTPDQQPEAALTSGVTETPSPTAEAAGKPTEAATQEATGVPTETATPEPTVIPTSEPSAVSASTPEPSAALTEAPGGNASSTADDTALPGVTIVVSSGEGSYAICKKLEQAGLVDDAAEFDAYLCGNGYHTKLRAGEHRIPVNAKNEEIAALLCK